jgi:hypothetical protein
MAAGATLTVAEVVYTVEGLQPGLVEPSLTVSEYTVDTIGTAVGF